MTNLRPLNNHSFFNRGLMDMNDIIDSFFKNDFPVSDLTRTSTFKVDIKAEDDRYIVEAELPGLTKDQIDIDLHDGRLTLTAEEKNDVDEENDNYIHRERRFSKMSRTMVFPDVDEDAVSATLEKGLLTIDLPKIREEEKETVKKIQIEERK
ncbi:MAG: Hsp20/alpha crystallin family protein [Peptoniphilus sp.]|nr:Hsp20/alpha crystallin family protein [Peptoniphilus sp.]MDD7363608.1 Hsp20/alpha crystallin family protein [Bacillota bacterium]MDY6045201.1 Hsp20/alpha crystallin family protein [Peptoniphilus sp.]